MANNTIKANKNTKKVYNFNAIRPALVAAHNQDNKKPISQEKCEDLDIDVSFFNQWVRDVRALQETVESYTDKAWNAKFDSKITEADIQAARELIYPKWKELLYCAESEKTARSLHVSEFDIEALAKFAWDFMGTGVGTYVCHLDDKKFRQKVESLIGCLIAGNGVLSDSERDTLNAYNSAQKGIEKCNDRAGELKKQESDITLKLNEIINVLTNSGATEQVIKLATQNYNNILRQIADDLKSNAELKAKYETTVHETAVDAQAIQVRVKYAGK